MSTTIQTEFRVGGKRFYDRQDAEDYARLQQDLDDVGTFLESYPEGRSRARAKSVMEQYFVWLRGKPSPTTPASEKSKTLAGGTAARPS